MEPKSSSPCSQQFTIKHCSQPVKLSTHTLVCHFFRICCNISVEDLTRVFLPQGFSINILYAKRSSILQWCLKTVYTIGIHLIVNRYLKNIFSYFKYFWRQTVLFNKGSSGDAWTSASSSSEIQRRNFSWSHFYYCWYSNICSHIFWKSWITRQPKKLIRHANKLKWGWMEDSGNTNVKKMVYCRKAEFHCLWVIWFQNDDTKEVIKISSHEWVSRHGILIGNHIYCILKTHYHLFTLYN